MSVWRLCVRELYARGPLPVAALQLAEEPKMINRGLRIAEQLGLVDHLETSRTAGGGLWGVNDLGRDWCEGRVELGGRVPDVRVALRGRGKVRPRATWLRALPRPGQVQMQMVAA